MYMEAYYTHAEERMNWLTHAVGLVLSIGGLVVLIVFSAIYGDPWHDVSFAIFGSTLVVLYTSSMLYHSLTDPAHKKLFKTLDHSAIFILIAGTYTPFMLVNLRGPWGWSMFGIIWIYAISGVILATCFGNLFKKISIATYLIMGWLCLIVARELFTNISPQSLLLLVCGGLAYSFGIFFLFWQKLPYNHAFWHICVLLGSIFHYFAVLYILQQK